MYEKVILEILQHLQALGPQLYLAQLPSCQFYQISKNTSFTEELWATASEVILLTISSGYFWQFRVANL